MIHAPADPTIIPQKLADRLGLRPVEFLTVSTLTDHIQVPLVSVIVHVYGQDFPIRPAVFRNIDQPLFGWDIIKQGIRHSDFINLIVGDVVHILDAIPSFKKNMVLVLGQDTSEIELLRSIQAKLKNLGYVGIIVKDIADIHIQSVE